jgi:hypothetical protein
MKLVRIGLIALVGAILLAPMAHAAEFIAPGGDNGTVTLSSDQTHGNLYIAGGNVTVNSTVEGDLFAAGGNITIGGEIRGDIMVAGGTVIINNTVTGDVRVAGGTVNINAPVNGDLLVGAGTLVLSEKALIGGEKGSDVVVSGGSVVIDSATIRAGVRIYGGQVRFNSSSLGDLYVEANEGLTFGPKSNIAGKITYHGPQEAVVEPGSNAAGIDFHKTERRSGHMKAAWAGLFTLGFLIKILAMLLAAWLFLKIRPRRFRHSIDSMYTNPWLNLGIGVVGLIVAPIVSIILLFTFVGWYVGLIGLLVYALLLLVSGLLAAVFTGSLILKWLTKKERQMDWQAILIGVVVLSLLKLIPIVGWLLCAVLFLMAFGALMRVIRNDVKAEQQVDNPPPSV